MSRQLLQAGQAFAILVMITVCVRAAEPLGPALGPRGPVGPDVPLSETEQKRLAQRVTVEGRTAAAVQAACEGAARENIRVVFLPAGEYVFDAEVRVAGDLTLLGDGSQTLIRAKAKDTHLFSADGDGVRFTRLRLQGASPAPSTDNDSYGISVSGKKNARIDHCELIGFSYATNFAAGPRPRSTIA